MIDKEQLINDIGTSFAGVLLKDGIGINQADRIEQRLRDVLIQKGRNLDRMWWSAWTDIDDKYPASYSSVMDYMDAAGIKWVMPAYMTYIVKHYKEGSFSVDSTIYTLEAGAKGTDNLDIFTEEQKRVIARFLVFMVSVGKEWVDVESAQNALDGVWGEWL
ncbi:MAG TPA: hypothetical protein EYG82_05830 [Sulfurovum sp.]|nr:hypothetical protein [Sulfurovum sp.]